eukprot:gene44073-53884_t
MRNILAASVFVTEQVHVHAHTVLVHCSDGWDRTPQVTSLAQILLDPFYRTVSGLCMLIEKDWCAFGHKFQDRSGAFRTSVGGGGGSGVASGASGGVAVHAGGGDSEERSPVFIQFLDCVHQLVYMYPKAFEYTEELLVFLADHSMSSLFGNFLGNSEKERVQQLKVKGMTNCIWDYVFSSHLLPILTNPSYSPYPQPLFPPLHIHNLRIWTRYWCRWDMYAHPNKLGWGEYKGWGDDWGNGMECLSHALLNPPASSAGSEGPPPSPSIESKHTTSNPAKPPAPPSAAPPPPPPPPTPAPIVPPPAVPAPIMPVPVALASIQAAQATLRSRSPSPSPPIIRFASSPLPPEKPARRKDAAVPVVSNTAPSPSPTPTPTPSNSSKLLPWAAGRTNPSPMRAISPPRPPPP